MKGINPKIHTLPTSSALLAFLWTHEQVRQHATVRNYARENKMHIFKEVSKKSAP
jgi:hypothetical protein